MCWIPNLLLFSLPCFLLQCQECCLLSRFWERGQICALSQDSRFAARDACMLWSLFARYEITPLPATLTAVKKDYINTFPQKKHRQYTQCSAGQRRRPRLAGQPRLAAVTNGPQLCKVWSVVFGAQDFRLVPLALKV
ncbi:hypothetical protein FKM82_024512 [Ascaphus truei]